MSSFQKTTTLRPPCVGGSRTPTFVKRCLRHTWSACVPASPTWWPRRSEEHTSELQSRENLVCRLLPEKKKKRLSTSVSSLKTSRWKYSACARWHGGSAGPYYWTSMSSSTQTIDTASCRSSV